MMHWRMGRCKQPRAEADLTTSTDVHKGYSGKGDSKGGGKSQSISFGSGKPYVHRNTPAHATLKEFCPVDQYRDVWGDSDDGDELKAPPTAPCSTHASDVFNQNSRFAPILTSPFGDLFITLIR